MSLKLSHLAVQLDQPVAFHNYDGPSEAFHLLLVPSVISREAFQIHREWNCDLHRFVGRCIHRHGDIQVLVRT